MKLPLKSIPHRYSIPLVYAFLFFLFFQLITDFIAAIYAIALLKLSFTIEVAAALFLFSPIILVFYSRPLSRKVQVSLGIITFFCWFIETMLNTRGRMFASGLGVACFLILFLTTFYNRLKTPGSWMFGTSLAFGVFLSIIVRSSGIDLSGVKVIKVGVLGLALLFTIYLVRKLPAFLDNPEELVQKQSDPYHPQTLKIIGLGLGISACLVLLYFTFTSPMVIARWTGSSYLLILAELLVTWSIYIIVLDWNPTLPIHIPQFILLVWNGLFILSLTLTLLAHQVQFPAEPSTYPIAPTLPPWHDVTLFLMLLFSPIILIDFNRFCQEIRSERPSIRQLGISFTVGSLFMLLAIFAQVFTTVYDYVPVVGPLFRDSFWLVFFVIGVILTLPVLLLKKIDPVEKPYNNSYPIGMTALMASVSIAIIVWTAIYQSTPAAPTETGTSVRVFTFNIQQGYSQDGQINIDGQLALIRSMKPDVIGLQECDTARISGGNADVVRYFADKLNMYSYYGPSTVAGTFGIALLSRYPIQNPRTYYLYSLGEQTAVITAQIEVGGITYNLFVTHLGNGGPIIQQEEVLQLVQHKENVLLMGDFNFKPDTEQYLRTTNELADAWLLDPSAGRTIQLPDPLDRIDYIYVSPNFQVTDARYLVGPESDHPALFMEVDR